MLIRQTTPSTGVSKNSQLIFWNKLLLLRSENLISELGETADLGNDAQFMLFVRYRANEDYVEQFHFCCPLAKHTTRKEMFKFKRVDSFTKEDELSSETNFHFRGPRLFQLGVFSEVLRRLMSWKLALYVLVIFSEQGVPIHKNFT